jgi:GT2 family glycosyltransferase
MYTCHLMAVRRSVMESIGGFRVGYEGAQDYDLLLRIMERTSTIHHIPKILYRWRKLPESAASALDAKPWAHEAAKRALADHLQRTGRDAEVLPGPASGSFRIRYKIVGSPLISILIPTRGDLRPGGALAACLASVAKTSYDRFEVIVVADDAVAPASIAGLSIADRIRWEICRQPSGFNFSEKINRGAAIARGEHLLLLNDDTEVLDAGWLEAMLEYSQLPEIGAVGAKLLYPDGRLQHIGLVLGVCGLAAHAFHQHPGSSFGYAGSAVAVRNYSAVSGACLMTRRRVFDEVGEFDPAFPVDFNDVDYCLRVRQAGYRIVFTPYARLTHREKQTTGARQPSAGEEARMRARWGEALAHDPYYNPTLSTEYPDYRLGS